MDAEMIRNMDGPALTRLAWELGLAPERKAEIDQHGRCLYFNTTIGFWNVWQPHEILQEADAVFRALRTRGWTTDVIWLANGREQGRVWVVNKHWSAVAALWPSAAADTEAHALLLVAVLAVASEER